MDLQIASCRIRWNQGYGSGADPGLGHPKKRNMTLTGGDQMGLHGRMWDLDGRPFLERRGRRAQGAFLWEEWPNSDADMGEYGAALRSRSCPQGWGGGCGKEESR